MSVITIPKPLRERLGDEATESFVSVIKEIEKDTRIELVTKADFKELEGDVKLLKWMIGFIITMNIGILLLLIRVLSVLPK